MTPINTNNAREFVTLMQAAIMARVHITNMYRLRNKLGAVKRDGIWYMPTDSLRNYIQRRSERARQILAVADQESSGTFFEATQSELNEEKKQ